MASKNASKDVKPAVESKRLEPVAPRGVLSPFEDMEQEMERMFDAAFGSNWMHPFRWRGPWWREVAAPFKGLSPSVDVIDREKEVLVRAEVPGITKDDLEVSLCDNRVTIHGSTRHEEKGEKGDYYRRELSSGSFSRTLTLPAEVDGTKAKATFKDGILELTLPKIKAAERHSINIE